MEPVDWCGRRFWCGHRWDHIPHRNRTFADEYGSGALDHSCWSIARAELAVRRFNSNVSVSDAVTTQGSGDETIAAPASVPATITSDKIYYVRRERRAEGAVLRCYRSR